MQIQEWSSGPLMRCGWRIDTDLFVHLDYTMVEALTTNIKVRV